MLSISLTLGTSRAPYHTASDPKCAGAGENTGSFCCKAEQGREVSSKRRSTSNLPGGGFRGRRADTANQCHAMTQAYSECGLASVIEVDSRRVGRRIVPQGWLLSRLPACCNIFMFPYALAGSPSAPPPKVAHLIASVRKPLPARWMMLLDFMELRRTLFCPAHALL
jgi:hypothetical protein